MISSGTLSRKINAGIFFILMVCGLLGTATAQAAIPAELAQAVDQIYNAKFASARATVNTYINRTPRDPAGYIVRGMLGEWDQTVNNRKGALNGAIMADYQKAVEYGEEALEKDPENPDKMVALGNAHMYLAKKLVDQGSKMKGGFELKKAKELMLQAIEKDPNNENAYMALGVFNYFSENVPSGFKWLATLLGFNGNKQDGLNYLKRAASNKNITQGDAGFLLVYIYGQKERNYATAIGFNEALKSRYPDNPSFQYETGELLYHQKKYDDAIASMQKYLGFCKAKGEGYCSKKYFFMAHHVIAKSQFDKDPAQLATVKDNVEAAAKYDEVLYKDRSADTHLWMGLLAKAKGDRAAAEESFRKVEAYRGANPPAWQIAQKELAALSATAKSE